MRQSDVGAIVAAHVLCPCLWWSVPAGGCVRQREEGNPTVPVVASKFASVRAIFTPVPADTQTREVVSARVTGSPYLFNCDRRAEQDIEIEPWPERPARGGTTSTDRRKRRRCSPRTISDSGSGLNVA